MKKTAVEWFRKKFIKNYAYMNDLWKTWVKEISKSILY